MGAFIHYAIAASIEALADSGFQMTDGREVPDDVCRKRWDLYQQWHR